MNTLKAVFVVWLLLTSSIAQQAESGTQVMVATQPDVFPQIKAALESPSVHVYLVLPIPEEEGRAAFGEGAPASSGFRFTLVFNRSDHRTCSLHGDNQEELFSAKGITVDECVFLVKHRLPNGSK
jgi:hypothetical protein